MISKQEFEAAMKAFQPMLEEMQVDDDPMEIFYGFNQEGKLGWHMIRTDYPAFFTYCMGESFEEALADLTHDYEEWKEEREDDEEDE